MAVVPVTAINSQINTGPWDRWQMADFGNLVVLANGTKTFGYNQGTTTVFTRNAVAVAAHGYTRFLYGNITGKTNWIGWSLPSGEDISHILSATTTPSARQQQQNASNEMPMPFRGNVLAIKPIGDSPHVVVYGTDGIAVLREQGSNYGLVQVPGLPANVGLASRYSLGTSPDAHLFLATDGNYYLLQSDLKVTRVSIAIATFTQPYISWDHKEQTWWISGPATSYVLSPYGVGGPVDAVYRSIENFPTSQFASGTSYPVNLGVEMWTPAFDMRDSGKKRVTFVRLLTDSMTSMKVACKTKFSLQGTATQMPWTNCGPEGNAYVNCEMLQGQIGYNAQAEPGARITRLEIRYQSDDRRAIRGTRGFSTENTGEEGE